MQILAEVQRGETKNFEALVEIARKHLDLLSPQELAELVSKLDRVQYKLFDRWFSDQPRYSFAVAVRTAFATCIAISHLEDK